MKTKYITPIACFSLFIMTDIITNSIFGMSSADEASFDRAPKYEISNEFWTK